MRTKNEDLNIILDSKVIAIIRSDEPSLLMDTIGALVDGGIKALEVTVNTPGALDAISAASKKFGDEILIGAGTVLDAETALTVLHAGAEFIVSPVFRRDVVKLANRYGKVVIPSGLTPTEILDAWESGADLIKLFPADMGGPAYLKSVKAPLNQVPIVAVGGVRHDNAADFIRAGAVALGIGSCVMKKEYLEKRDFVSIAQACRDFMEILRGL